MRRIHLLAFATAIFAVAINSRAEVKQSDLLFLEDFDLRGYAILKNASILKVPLTASFHRKGKYGLGYFFEKPSHNFFDEEVAGSKLNVARFSSLNGGETVLASVSGGKGLAASTAIRVSFKKIEDGVQVDQRELNLKHRRSFEKRSTLLASCYVKGPAGKKILMKLSFESLPKNELTALVAKKKKGKSNSKTEPLLPDESFPLETTLSGEWQRIAVYATGDGRVPKRSATLSLTSLSSDHFAILAKKFQLEQANYYPYRHLMPTTWLPGGTKRGSTATTIRDRTLLKKFPVNNGTISFWTKTPHSSNLKRQGGIVWLSFGISWHNPIWQMGTYRCQAGTKDFAYFRGKVLDGKWHHLAMTWTPNKATVYVDGSKHKEFKRTPVDISGKLENFKLMLGGSVQDNQSANSIMDDIAIFNRALSNSEIAEIAKSQTQLARKLKSNYLLGTDRKLFSRSEIDAALDLTVLMRSPYVPPEKGFFSKMTSLFSKSETHSATLTIADVVSATKQVSLKQGVNELAFHLAPWKLRSNIYNALLTIKNDRGETATLPLKITIAPKLPRIDAFHISSWGRGMPSKEWLNFYKTLGFDMVDSVSPEMELLGENRMLYNWHCRIGSPNDWIRKLNFASIESKASEKAASIAKYPNWISTIINSETGTGKIPSEGQLASNYKHWAEKRFGFKIPEKAFRLGSPHNPPQVWLADNEKTDSTGVVEKSSGLRFMNWFNNFGAPWWQTNFAVARGIKKVRPDVATWTDPIRAPGQISGLDGGSNWAYDRELDSTGIVYKLKDSHAIAKLAKKPFFPTLGMNYVGPSWLNVQFPDGKKRLLSPTVDDLTKHAWIAVTSVPSDRLNYWAVIGLFDGVRKGKYYCAKNSVERFGRILKNEIKPLGELLKGVPLMRGKVALLMPTSTFMLVAGEGKWSWGAHHYSNFWKSWLTKSDIRYDVILDESIDELKNYSVILFPMGHYVTKRVYDALTEASAAGSLVVVDEYCRQTYPKMEKWNVKYRFNPKSERAKIEKQALSDLNELKKRMRKIVFARTKVTNASVFTFVRESAGIKYVSVINNARKTGEYTTLTEHPEFKPYGKPQSVKLSLRIPEKAIVYDFLESKLLKGTYINGRRELHLKLPPASGKLICVYPRKIASLRLKTQGKSHPKGSAFNLNLALSCEDGSRVQGAQLIELRITTPSGEKHDESGLYQMKNGLLNVKLRLAANDPSGEWKIIAKEKTSGLTAAAKLNIK